jgi:hypothetical protein
MFKQFLTGQASRRVHGRYLIILALLCLVFLVTSGSFYLVPFTFRIACPSNLGNPVLNPGGWWIFSVLFIVAGPALVPHYVYLYRKIYPVAKALTRGMFFFLLVSAVGMTGVGIVNETTWPPHAFLAGLVFGGVGLAMGFSLPIFIRKIQLGHACPRPWALVVFMAIIFAFIGLMVGEFVMYDQGMVPNLYLAEWYAFFGILTWIFGVFFLLPGKEE